MEQGCGQGCHAWLCSVCTAHGHWAGGEREQCLPEEGIPFLICTQVPHGLSRRLGGGHFRQRAQPKGPEDRG